MALGSATQRAKQRCSGYSYTTLSAIYTYKAIHTHEVMPEGLASCSQTQSHEPRVKLIYAVIRQRQTQTPCGKVIRPILNGRRHAPRSRVRVDAKVQVSVISQASDVRRHAPCVGMERQSQLQSLASRSWVSVIRRSHTPTSYVGVIRHEQRRAHTSCVTRHSSCVERQSHTSKPYYPV